eukprot:CAMPEP_0198305226 /NCGR_PEP_ID=MMETSP1449-20131203/57802_1 /TAXON_ID=420275 /ORGANISM="Attheya septentrionalis, Strain CCMP2084" /LENGTH=281 /DNA_ID=CAMNT_0044007759 /DNA_START=255 /DNA_END=1096 /DNA_ORIENTATION=+
MVALTPILSWELANCLSAIKTLISTHLVTPFLPSDASHTILKTGTVTCRFEVDLKGVVRFIGNKKEEREERHEGHDGDDQVVNVAVTHIVVKAVALALSEIQVINCTRINIPLLGVDNYYPNSSVSVSVDMNNHASQFPTKSDIITLHDVSKLPVEDIAHRLTKKDTPTTASTGSEVQKKRGRLSMLVYSLLDAVLGQYVAERLMSGDASTEGPMLGNCLVFTTPDSENNQVDIDVAPAPSHGNPSIVVVIGGIRVKKVLPLSSKPMLTMSIVLDCPAVTV